MTRVLVVGSGFVGQRVAAALDRAGGEAVLASRHPVPAAWWVRLDATDPTGCVRVVTGVRPDAVVAVHGPSDVTWCERYPERALAAHREATRNLVRAAGATRLLMISTDNVFAGVAEHHDEESAVAPANAYGRAKLAAEAVLDGHPDATVLRVSLIYGPEAPSSPQRYVNFAASCLRALRAGQPVYAPADQWTTPVHVDDVAAVTLAALRHAPRLLHLGGPDRISRAAWAGRLADLVDADRALVRPVPKDAGRYACRPTNSCLSSTLLPGLLRGWGLRVRGVDDGAAALLEEAR